LLREIQEHLTRNGTLLSSKLQCLSSNCRVLFENNPAPAHPARPLASKVSFPVLVDAVRFSNYNGSSEGGCICRWMPGTLEQMWMQSTRLSLVRSSIWMHATTWLELADRPCVFDSLVMKMRREVIYTL